MTLEQLRLRPGSVMQLQYSSGDAGTRMASCRYVGAVGERYLIILPPKGLRLRTGQKVLLRAMLARGIAMLAVTVESLSNTPVPLVYLSCPAAASFHEVRSARRVDVSQAVVATNQKDPETLTCAGRLVDISTSGAKVELKQVLASVGDQLQLRAELDIAGQQRTLLLPALVRARTDRSTQEEASEYPAVYGVEFSNLDADGQLLLHAYVYQQLVEE